MQFNPHFNILPECNLKYFSKSDMVWFFEIVRAHDLEGKISLHIHMLDSLKIDRADRS